MIRSSILVREPCGGAKEEKRRTRRQHLAGKRQALRAREGGRGGRGRSARAALPRRATRAVPRDTPDRERLRENPGRDRGLRRVEARRATDLEGVRFLGGGVVPARLGEHLGASDELHGVRGGGLDEREALKIGGGGDGGHGDVRAVGSDARSADAGGDGGANATKKTRRPRNVVFRKRNERRKQTPDRSVFATWRQRFRKRGR